MKKTFVGLFSMAVFPLAAHATLQSITLDLINDAGSVTNPISVQDGYVEFPDGICNVPTASIPLSQLAPMPLSVQTQTETSVSLPVTPAMIACLSNPSENGYLYIRWHITTVDGKSKKGDSSCVDNQMIDSPNAVNPVDTLKIQETTDTFNCSMIQFKK